MRVFLSTILAGLAICVSSQLAQAQTAEVLPDVAEEQNETFRDTLVRMRIKREEEEHKKVVTKAEQIKAHAEELLKITANTLPRDTEKRLREIEKNARNIRSDAGGGDDVPLENPPVTLNETSKLLLEKSESLNKLLGKTSRHIVSITVSAQATEIIQLVKLLRTFLR
jgi:hypothetical protein